MRKRIISVLIVLVFLTVGFAGCGEKTVEIDPVSQKVIADIQDLGEITLDDQAAIEKIEKTYTNLTDDQKKQVNNYIDLLNARDTLDALLLEEANRVSEFHRVTRNFYPLLDKMVSSVKTTLKNPSTLVIHNIYVATDELYENEDDVLEVFFSDHRNFPVSVEMSYSANNDVGGAVYLKKNLSAHILSTPENPTITVLDQTFFFEDYLGSYEANETEIEGIYKYTTKNGKSRYFFEVDVEDFLNQVEQ